jgi:hypothetical protein
MDMMISLPRREKGQWFITLAQMAEWRLYKMAHLQTAKSGFPNVSELAARQLAPSARLTHAGSVAAR